MLKLDDIYVTLGWKTALERSVLQGVSLDICPGDFAMIIGCNGAGKSTLMNVISGAVRPDRGTVLFDKSDVTSMPLPKRSRWVATVVQNPKEGSIESMSIFENMAFALKRGQRRHLWPYGGARKWVQSTLALLKMGLEDRLDDLVITLSGGQRQALSLMMAIARPSKILLLDEITASLDPNMARHIMNLTNRIIQKEQRTALMVTHNMAYALEYGNRVVLLDQGKVARTWTNDEKHTLTPQVLMDNLSEL